MRINSRVSTIIKLVAFTASLVMFVFFFDKITSVNSFEGEKIQKRNIERAITDCYSIEGMYPPDFSYIVDNYGVKVDDSKYYVDYNVFATNVRPVVTIVKRGTLTVDGDNGE